MGKTIKLRVMINLTNIMGKHLGVFVLLSLFNLYAFGGDRGCTINSMDTGCVNQSTSFSYSCSNAGSVHWYIGSIDKGTTSSISHTFTTAGTYTIYLQQSNGGGTTTYSKNIVIEAVPNTPIINASATEFCEEGGDATFTISNVQSGVSYSWFTNPGGLVGTGTSLSLTGIDETTVVSVYATLPDVEDCGSSASVTVNIWETTISPVADAAAPYHKKVLRGSGGLGTQTVHFWQTSPTGTEIANNLATDYTVTNAGTYYIRRRSTYGSCWTAASSGLVVSLNNTPPQSSISIVQKYGYSEVNFINADREHILNYANYYWVSANASTTIVGDYSIGGELREWKKYQNGTYYLRGRDVGTGTWGATQTVNVTLMNDNDLNWIQTKTFDGDSDSAFSESKQYFDEAGRLLQSQTKSIARGVVFATQDLRDKYDRIAGSTLPAPIAPKDFKYNSDFLQDGLQNQYDTDDFDSEDTKLTPNPVGIQNIGTVGWYYSNQNTLEPLVGKTNFPYSRTEFYEDGTGEIKRSASPGNYHRLGMGHEVLSGTFPVFMELDDYLSKRSTVLSGITQGSSLKNQAIQVVQRDANGKFSISITDRDKNVLLIARKGTLADHVLQITNEAEVSAESESSSGMMYFYILDSQPVDIDNTGTWTIENIVTGEKTEENETFEDGGGNWPPGFYKIVVSEGETTVAWKNYLVDVSYSFYNDLDKLVSSVSPNGYKAWKSGLSYASIDKTTYVYNFKGWLLSVTEPDAGTSTYKYRRDGKIRFSQNAQQAIDGTFSYTHYDSLDRPVESGEYTGTEFAYGSGLNEQLEYGAQEIYTSNTKDWLKTTYDNPDSGFGTETDLGSIYSQKFLDGAVSYSENENIKTWYSYDELGRVTWMAQKPKALSRVFVATYEYDFLGNVLKSGSLTYISDDLIESFYHHYEYDADKRLKRAYTSVDGESLKLRATYTYYLHGPLKRVMLGDSIQGIDFVYNIHGWLTQINHPSLDPDNDPGHDGENGVRKDAFGMVLDYYESEMEDLFPTAAIHNPRTPEQFHNIHRIPGREEPEAQRLAYMDNPKLVMPSTQEQWTANVHAARKDEYAAIDVPEISQPDPVEIEVSLLPDETPGPVTDIGLSPDLATLTASINQSSIVDAVPVGAVDDALEFAALKALYDSLGGSSWTTKTNWPAAGSWPSSATPTQMDSWYGITVVGGDITGIVLAANNLTGKIPAAIANLTALKELTIRSNNISGKIPAAIFSLTALERLELYSNQLTGGIPSGLSALTNLKYLRLYSNPLGGSIPSSLGSLTNLEQLQIASCQLTGTIPGSLKNLSHLTVLEINSNSFTGTFPPLGKLTNLQVFTANALTSLTTAAIPSWLDSLRNLTTLNLENSKRNGSIPTFIGNLTHLQILNLRNNQLTGSIPNEISNLTSLTSFTANTNQLSGSIPADIGELDALITLFLYGNQLTGEIPPSLYDLDNITNLRLYTNQLSGTLSEDIGRLTKLVAFDLHDNAFVGEIPATMGALTNLITLDLGDNQFSGSLPLSLKFLTKLQTLNADANQLTGSVPDLGPLTQLQFLQFQSNQLSGSIGSWISALTKLVTFRIDNNKITSVDSGILSLPLLANCYLQTNELTTVPNFYSFSNKANLNLYVYGNYLDFSDLEPLFGSGTHGIKIFSYNPQKKFNTLLKLHVPTGGILEKEAQPKGSYSTVTWEKQNGASWTSMNSGNENTTQQTYKKSGVTTAINGYYRWRMTNSRVTGLTLECDPIEIQAVDALPAEPSGPALFNGIIASARWQTEKPVTESGDNLNGMYLYKYDEKYQIADANFAEPNHLLGTFATQANKFRVTNLAYDPNGNIKTLNRYDKDGVRTNNFSYTYASNKNQLTDVSGHTSTGISGHGYGYNAIGQMTGTDKTTGEDQYVTYDVSGKVRKVYSNAAKTDTYLKVEYLYDDRGFRLAKYSKTEDRTTWYIRDASGTVMSIYEQDGAPSTSNAHALTQIEVPVYGSGKIGTYYPAQDGSVNYELTDHLGNVRAIVRENVNIYTATMEDNGEADIANPRVQEGEYFQNLFETEMEDARFNHTPALGAEYSAYLYWIGGSATANKKIGPAITLKVNAGDTVSAEAWVRFENKLSYSRNTNIAAIAGLLAGNFSFTTGFEGFTLPQTTTAFSNALTSAGFMGDGAETDKPFAYINYILYDESMTMVDAGWQRVDESMGFDAGQEALTFHQHKRLAFDQPIYVPQNGYIYVWVSNESEGTKVWFDDVRVTHTQITVTQASDYGLWGDVLRELKSPEITYRHGYQGNFSEKDEETGWNHFELREYDPVIGRWLSKDPAGQYYSPYVGMGNNPISGIDPDGAWVKGAGFWRNLFRSDERIQAENYAAQWSKDFASYTAYEYEGTWGVLSQNDISILHERDGKVVSIETMYFMTFSPVNDDGSLGEMKSSIIPWRPATGEVEFDGITQLTLGFAVVAAVPATTLRISGLASNLSWRAGAAYNYSNLVLSQAARNIAYSTAIRFRPLLLGPAFGTTAWKFGSRFYVNLIDYSRKGNLDVFKAGKTIVHWYRQANKVIDNLD